MDRALDQATFSRGVEVNRLLCNAHLAMAAPRVPLAVHLDPLLPEERALWDRYAGLVAAAGPSEMIVNKSRIAFKAPHRNFTGCFFKSRRLELFFDLPEPVPESEQDSRFRAVWAHSRTIWVHRLKIGRLDELDEKLGRWLAAGWEAYSRPAAEAVAPGKSPTPHGFGGPRTLAQAREACFQAKEDALADIYRTC